MLAARKRKGAAKDDESEEPMGVLSTMLQDSLKEKSEEGEAP